MRIIVVDDEPKIRTGMQYLLSKHTSWDVEAFADAAAALQHLYDFGADVIITDIKMPEISGLDMLAEIRQTNALIPILILSGYSRFDYAQRAIELGVKRYFTKPTDPAALIKELESIESSQQEQLRELREEVGEQNNIQNLQILRAIQYMKAHCSEKVSLSDVAKAVYISPNYLSDLFRKTTGLRFSDYLLQLRMERAAHYLLQPGLSLSDVAQTVGFTDTRYFSTAFKKYHGMTPSEFRNKNATSSSH